MTLVEFISFARDSVNRFRLHWERAASQHPELFDVNDKANTLTWLRRFVVWCEQDLRK